MKRIFLLLLASGILCGVSCAPKENTINTAAPSESVIKAEASVTETDAWPASASVEPQPVAAPVPAPQRPVVKMVTSKGEIEIELYADKAPMTVENFLTYVRSGFYNGTIFHRVIKGFMIQGGGMTGDLQEKPTRPAIKNESYNQLRNQRGTVAMARTSAPNSATSQFFINHVDNRPLDFDGAYPPGYAVFGKVIKGIEVVDAIAATPTKSVGPHANIPVETIAIQSVTILE